MSGAIVPIPRVPVTVRPATPDDVPFMDSLQRLHAKQVGWMPTKQFEGKIKLGHVLVSHEPNARGVVDDLLAQRGLERNVALRVSHFLLVPPIIAATDYVAALSEIVARPAAKGLRLQLLKMPLKIEAATVHMVWHERTVASPAHAWFRAVVEEVGRGIEMSCREGVRAR